MSTPDDSAPAVDAETPPKVNAKKRRRWLRRLLWLVVLAPLLSLLALNLALNLGVLSGLLNNKPEKTRVRWNFMWTAWPSTLHVYGLSVRGQSPRQQWHVSLNTARLDINPALLLQRRFHVEKLTGEGLSYRQRRRLDWIEKDQASVLSITLEEEGDPTELSPPIPGLSNPPDPKPEEIYPPFDPTRPPGWRIDVMDFDIGAEELWLESYRYNGAGRVTGQALYQVRGDLEITDARIELTSGAIWVGEDRIAEGVATVTGKTLPFRTREYRGIKVLRVIDGRAQLEGRTQDLAFLRYYLDRVPWLSLNGSGELRADLHLDGGLLQPGSVLDLTAGDVRADYVLYRTRGDGRILGRVTQDPVEESESPEAADATNAADADSPSEATPARLQIIAELDRFSLTRRGMGERTFIQGDDLRLVIGSEETDLLAEHPRLKAELVLPESDLPDLTAYNVYFPPDSGIHLTKGSGRFEAKMTFDSFTRSGAGSVRLRASEAGLHVNQLHMSGNLDFKSQFSSQNLEETAFQLDNTRLTFRNATLREDDGEVLMRNWHAEIDIPRAQLDLEARGEPGYPGRFRGAAQARMLDSRPLLALAQIGSVDLPSWSEGLLTVDNVKMNADLRMDGRVFEIRRLRVTGSRGVEIRSEMRLKPDKKRDILLYMTYGPLSAGAEIHDQQQDWKLRGAKDWFQEREGSFLKGSR